MFLILYYIIRDKESMFDWFYVYYYVLEIIDRRFLFFRDKDLLEKSELIYFLYYFYGKEKNYVKFFVLGCLWSNEGFLWNLIV